MRWRRSIFFSLNFLLGNRVSDAVDNCRAIFSDYMSKGKHFTSFSVSLPFAEINTQPDFKVSDYKKIFDKFDVDSGGTIDAQELGTLIRGLGLVNVETFVFLLCLDF